MDLTWIYVVVPFVSAGLGAYVGGYLKKKGENLATHEDVDKLLKQVTAVTQTAKTIEATISSEVWDRQKLWELRREVLFGAAKVLAEVDDALLELDSMVQVGQSKPEDDPVWIESVVEKCQKWTATARRFDEAKLLVAVTCSKETAEAFNTLGILVFNVASQLTKRRHADVQIYRKSQQELALKVFAAMGAIRKELGV